MIPHVLQRDLRELVDKLRTNMVVAWEGKKLYV
jgi:hypothetical protein